MKNFEIRKFVAPEFVIGTDVRKIVTQYLENYNIQKILLVTDKTVSKLWWFNDILNALRSSYTVYKIFDAVTPNPRDEETMAGADVFLSNGCQGILAVGGGSVMDAAKGIGIVANNGKNIIDYEGVDQIEAPCPPIICIPTTAGTSSDVSQFTIIKNTRNKVKIAIISKILVPDIALIDPVVTTTKDKYLTACTGIDALTHAFEAFVSTGSSAITDHHALNAVRLIKEYLPKAVNNPEDMEARYNMMIGSLEAGLAFSNASLGAVHAMAHSLGGLYDLPHGECNAILLPHVVNFNFSSDVNKYSVLGELMGLDKKIINTKNRKNFIVNLIEEFKQQVGIESKLSDKSVNSDDLPHLSLSSEQDPCLVTNPRRARKDDLHVIFGEAM